MPVDQEAAQLVALFEGRPVDLMTFLSTQLAVLKTQASMMMGLAGLTITVTGFSGHLMVRAGALSSGFMVAGVVGVLFAVVLTIRVILTVRWVSQDLGPDLLATVTTVIERRDSQQLGLQVAGAFLAFGLSGYLISVVISAFANGVTS